MQVDPNDYRREHPRCRYCKYFTSWAIFGGIRLHCKAKNTNVNPDIPRGRFSLFRCKMYIPEPCNEESKDHAECAQQDWRLMRKDG